jgi:hypothetical protein
MLNVEEKTIAQSLKLKGTVSITRFINGVVTANNCKSRARTITAKRSKFFEIATLSSLFVSVKGKLKNNDLSREREFWTFQI